MVTPAYSLERISQQLNRGGVHRRGRGQTEPGGLSELGRWSRKSGNAMMAKRRESGSAGTLQVCSERVLPVFRGLVISTIAVHYLMLPASG